MAPKPVPNSHTSLAIFYYNEPSVREANPCRSRKGEKRKHAKLFHPFL